MTNQSGSRRRSVEPRHKYRASLRKPGPDSYRSGKCRAETALLGLLRADVPGARPSNPRTVEERRLACVSLRDVAGES
jgi:hypothetical protein